MPKHTRKERQKNKRRNKSRARVTSIFTGPIPTKRKKRKK